MTPQASQAPNNASTSWLKFLLQARITLVLVILFAAGVAAVVWHISHLQTRLVRTSAITNAKSYSEALALGSSLLGRLVLAALVALPLWKGVHHIRHLSMDFGGGERDAVVAPLLYLVAVVGSLLAIVAVVRL